MVDPVKDIPSTISLSSDRRTIIVIRDSSNMIRICAEPPPDTATAIVTQIDTQLKAQAKGVTAESTLKDKLEESIVVLAHRTAALDAFRIGIYALCQYYINGAITSAEVKSIFEKLLDAFVVSSSKAEPSSLSNSKTEPPSPH